MASTSSNPQSSNPLAAKPGQPGIDPRGPRFGATITVVLLAIDVVLGLTGVSTTSGTTLAQRVADPAFILLVILTVIFAWGAFAGIQRHPYGVIFKKFIRPNLSAPSELEDPKPPTFAQLIGFIVAGAGLVLGAFAVPYGVAGAAAAAFVAAFLNAAFAFCLGCQMYLGLKRFGVIR